MVALLGMVNSCAHGAGSPSAHPDTAGCCRAVSSHRNLMGLKEMMRCPRQEEGKHPTQLPPSHATFKVITLIQAQADHILLTFPIQVLFHIL